MLLRLILLFLLFGGNVAFAFEEKRTVESVATTDSTKNPFTIIQVNSTFDTVSESLVNTGVNTSLGVMWQATSSGTVNFSLQALRSFQRPTSETLTDATYIPWNAVNTTTDTGWHMATLDTVIEPYLRFRIKTLGSDPTTTVQIKVEKL